MGNKRLLQIVSVLIIVAFISVLIANRLQNKTNKNQVIYGQPIQAPAGELTPNFPKQLILGDIKVASSNTIPYQEGGLLSAKFTTTQSLSSVYSTYLKYFADNGYVVTNKKETVNQAMIYAIKNKEQVLFSAIKVDKVVTVSISQFQNSK